MFGELVVCYLFLGGAGTGACLVAGVMGLLVPADALAERRSCASRRAYAPLFLPVIGVALVALLLGIACLAADLGRADRLLLVFLQPTFSHVTVGAWALAACALLAVALLLFWGGAWRRCPVLAMRVASVLLAVAALVAMVYAGLLLYSMPSVPLWSTAWLPALFVCSSLSCGVALALAASALSGSICTFGRVCRGMARADTALIALEALVFAAFVAACVGMTAKSGSATEAMAAASAFRLLSGDLAPLFWGGFALSGMAVPAAAEVLAMRSGRLDPHVALVVSVLVLAGGFAMRYCLVQAGAHPLLV